MRGKGVKVELNPALLDLTILMVIGMPSLLIFLLALEHSRGTK